MSELVDANESPSLSIDTALQQTHAKLLVP